MSNLTFNLQKVKKTILFFLFLLSCALIFSVNTSAQTITIGTGTSTANSMTPYHGASQDARKQYLILASELTTAGLPANDMLTSLAFDVTTKASSIPFAGFTIKLAHTSVNDIPFGSPFLSESFTTVYSSDFSTTANQWNVHNFSTNFQWNGTDNILVEVCFDNSSSTGSDYIRYTSISGKTLSVSGTGTGCTMTSPSLYGWRPNMRFTHINPSPCAVPSDQPTNLILSNITHSTIDGSFTDATSNPDNYLVVRSTSSTLSSNPVNGTTYSAGDPLGGGVVVQAGSSTSFSADNLTPETTYYFFIFSYNSSCTGGPLYQTTNPLTGNETTDVLPPTCDYSIKLVDTYGDSWNGGAIDIFVNGVEIITNETVTYSDNGGDWKIINFTVNTGDEITTDYTSGSYSTENEYYIYDAADALGTLVFSSGTGGATPSDLGAGVVIASCPEPCATPSNQPTTLVLTPDYTEIQGSFTAATGSPDEYLVVMNTSSSLSANPTDGVTYSTGDPLGGGTVVQTSSATSFTATGLSMATTYYFFIFSYNSACVGGPLYYTTSPLTGNATTLSCTVSSFPFIENFDGETPPALPTCWSAENTNSDSYEWITSTNNPNSAPNCMYLGYYSGSTMNDWSFTPPLELQAGTTYKVQFEYRGYGSSYPQKLEVKWGASASSAGMTESQIFNNDAITNTTYELGEGTFTPSADGIYYVGWYGYSSAYYKYLYVDDISIFEYPECSTPTNQPTDLTLTESFTQITGSFSDATTIPDGYLVVASTSSTLSGSPVDGTIYNAGDPLGGGTVVQAYDLTDFTASGLSTGTTYYFFIFSYNNSNCSGGPKYLTTNPLTGNATTLDCTISSFPHLETFESLTIYSGATSSCDLVFDINSQICWINQPSGTTIGTDTDNTDWLADNGATPTSNTGPSTDHTLGTTTGKYLYVESTCSWTKAFIETNVFDVSGLTVPTLSFWFYKSGNLDGNLVVDAYYDGAWHNDLWTFTGSGWYSNGWTEVTVDLSAAAGFSDMQVRFRTKETTSGENFDVAIDDVKIFDNIPCEAPINPATDLVLTPDYTEIDGSFTSSADAFGYLVVMSENSTLSATPVDNTTYNVGDPLGGGTVVYSGENNYFTATGLTEGTDYYFFVFAFQDFLCTGGPTYNTTSLDNNTTTLICNSNNAFDFDGIDDYARIPDDPSLEPASITIEAWIKADTWETDADYGTIVNKETNISAEGYMLRVGDEGNDGDGGEINFCFATGSSSYSLWNDCQTSGLNLLAGEWYHIAATYDGTTQKIYLNGELKASSNVGAAIYHANTDLQIGGKTINSVLEPVKERYFDGMIDEVRIWKTARTEQEIYDNMCTNLDPSLNSNLVAYYDFSICYGNDLPDLTSYHNDGMLSNNNGNEWGLASWSCQNYWTGDVSTEWDDPLNWSKHFVPTSTDDAIIPDVHPTTNRFPYIECVAECLDLDIHENAFVEFAPNTDLQEGHLTVFGEINNEEGIEGIIIHSDATGTGSLIHTNSGVPATVETFLEGTCYHYISSPVDVAPASLYTSPYFFYWDPTMEWFGMGDNPPATIDYAPWIPYPSGNLVIAKGYANHSAEQTITYQGNLNVEDYTHTLYKSAITTSNDFEQGWNLLGNPYASAIDWEKVVAPTGNGYPASVESALYLFDDNDGTGVQANYRYYVPAGGSGGTYGVGTGDATQYIPVGQGFFVRTTTNNVDLELLAADRSHGTQTFYKNEPADLIRLKIYSEGGEDELIVRFIENSTLEFDAKYDARKLFPTNTNVPQFYTFTNSETRAAINSVPKASNKIIIPMGVRSNASNFTIKAIDQTLTDGWEVYLKDNLLHKMTQLNSGTVCDLQVNQYIEEGRFELVFVFNETATNTTEVVNKIRLYPNPVNSILKIDLSAIDENGKIEILNSTGTIFEITNFDKKSVKEIDMTEYATGVYFLRVSTENNVYINKIIKN